MYNLFDRKKHSTQITEKDTSQNREQT